MVNLIPQALRVKVADKLEGIVRDSEFVKKHITGGNPLFPLYNGGTSAAGLTSANLAALIKNELTAATSILGGAIIEALRDDFPVESYKQEYQKNVSNGRPIIIIPGYGENRGTMFPFMDHLRYRDLPRAYALNIDPFRNSEKTVNGRVLRRTKEILEQTGHDKADLVGYSWGGCIVRDFAQQYPELVDHCVMLDATLYGAVAAYFGLLGYVGKAIPEIKIGGKRYKWSGESCKQMLPGSAYLEGLRTPKENDPVMYVNVFNETTAAFYGSGPILDAVNIGIVSELGEGNQGHMSITIKGDVISRVADTLETTTNGGWQAEFFRSWEKWGGHFKKYHPEMTDAVLKNYLTPPAGQEEQHRVMMS